MTALAERPAARIVLLDREGRVLLFRFQPHDRAPFWATPGGALDAGESYREGARRELWEETGIEADPGEEIARRLVRFVTLEGTLVEADERYFLIRTDTARISTAAHTELEQRVMTRWGWFSPADLEALDERYFPEDLIEMVAEHKGRLHAG